MTRTLIKKLWLPFDSVKTLYEGPSEVRLYQNNVTGVFQIGKRISALGNEQAVAFREATLLQSIQHDHIVPVYDVAVVEETGSDPLIKTIEMIIPYYVLGSAYDALRDGERFSIAEAVRLTREALVGLNELHERHRLLHRDIKSANVFIDEKRRIRVGDLGVAIPMEADGRADARPDAQLYTAPETMITRRVDRRTDIYGIGLILFELLNGPFPYDDYSRVATASRLGKGRRPLLDKHLTFKPCVPRRLRQIVRKAISRNAGDRYADAPQMMDALDRAPFIDWHQVEDAADHKVWEGRSATDPERSYRVTATKYRRQDRWKFCGEDCINRWQRCVADQVIDDPMASEATAFFDQLVRHATSR